MKASATTTWNENGKGKSMFFIGEIKKKYKKDR